jgi:hypothetical protein
MPPCQPTLTWPSKVDTFYPYSALRGMQVDRKYPSIRPYREKVIIRKARFKRARPGSGCKKKTWPTYCCNPNCNLIARLDARSLTTRNTKSTKVFGGAKCPDFVIPEVVKSACGGESRVEEGLLDTPSTSLKVVSPSTWLRTVSWSNGLSNHGSRLRRLRYDISVLCQQPRYINC